MDLTRAQMQALALVLVEAWALADRAAAARSVIGKHAVDPLREALEVLEITSGGVISDERVSVPLPLNISDFRKRHVGTRAET